MILIENKDNANLIRKYLNQDVKFDDKKFNVERLATFKPFESELQKVPQPEQGNALASLMSEYEFKDFIALILNKYEVVEEMDSETTIDDDLRKAFDALMLEVAREIMVAKLSEEGKLWIYRKRFAERIMELYTLTINEKDPDIILIYNHMNGRWEDGKIAISRLIIEVAHYLGGNVSDSWTASLERSVLDILFLKVKLIDPKNFNQIFYPFENETLDTETAEMVSHSEHHLATMGSDVSYNPGSACPVFENFLKEVFEKEEGSITFIQEWFGYVLSGNHKANALLIGVGAGANGKSTLFDVLARLVGLANVSSAPLSNFGSEFGLEPLLGMKLNLATESDADAFKTGKLKALTAGEAISVNRKNKPEITIALPTKLVFLVNELPMLSDSSMGFERRLIILPFNQTFTPIRQNKDLPKQLHAELDGILNWALAGLIRLIENKYQFTISEAMSKAKETYFGIGNPVECFVKEKIIAQPSCKVETPELFNYYRLWMSDKGYPFKGTGSPQVFWKEFEIAALKQHIECTKKQSNGKYYVHDIAVRNEP
jgi:putative DNA primase/helicase